MLRLITSFLAVRDIILVKYLTFALEIRSILFDPCQLSNCCRLISIVNPLPDAKSL